jgi:FKBP-type peptidyl-prolyl cis-trans isomerase FklB
MKKQLIYLFAMMMGLCGLSSCSEDTSEENDFENWQQRNEVFFASLEDSLASNTGTGVGQWKKFKSYSKDSLLTTGSNTDCIYVKVLEQSTSTTDQERPMAKDSVRLSYQGRLIPTKLYAQGFVFDGTVYGAYNPETNATRSFKLSTSLVPGFYTALLHMRRGDTWRIYIPYQLGYGASTSGSIPGYSTLIFDLTLFEIAREGQSLPIW